MSDIRFDERVAVITGAVGGLGRSYALALADRGARVVVNDLGGATDGSGADQSMADAVVEEIRARGGDAVANYDSVATPEGGAAIIQSALAAFGRIDILINNAGILRDKSFAKMTVEEWDAVIGVHLRGAFCVTQPAFRAMKEAGYGRLLFTSSAAGIFGNFGQANYGAAKMALVGLSGVLSIEGQKHDIRSNVISPMARTRLSQHVLGPMGDMLDIELVTPMAVYLVSEACPSTHGIYSVGGGRFARVFVGLGRGWMGPAGTAATPEQVRDAIEQIDETEGFSIPGSATDEMMALAGQLTQ